MHSHIIPGIDDGAKDLEDAVHLTRKLVELGYTKIITTPHIMGEYYLNTPEIIKNGLLKLRQALASQQIAIEVEAAAEYNVDEHFESLINSGQQLLTFFDNYILIEFSTFALPGRVHEIIFQLKARGYKVILAHPERYLYLSKQLDVLKELKSLGVFFQVNLLSLAGHYGPAQKKMGIKLLNADWVEFLGTDLHRKEHIKKLSSIFQDKKVANLILERTFMNTEL